MKKFLFFILSIAFFAFTAYAERIDLQYPIHVWNAKGAFQILFAGEDGETIFNLLPKDESGQKHLKILKTTATIECFKDGICAITIKK